MPPPSLRFAQVTGPANFIFTAMSKRLKCTITLEDLPEDPAMKRVRVVGSEEKGVTAAVAEIRVLAGPLPLLGGVPVAQHVFDRWVECGRCMCGSICVGHILDGCTV
jgi:hypothetical protein